MESVLCDYCGQKNAATLSLETKLLMLPSPYAVVQCQRCGLVYMNPRMTAEEYRAFYSSKYFDSYDYGTILSSERNPKFLRRVRSLAHLKPGRGRLLDIGTATGEFLKAARDDGWNVWGTEVSEDAARKAKEMYGLDVYTGDLERAPYEEGFFDIVHLSHVLEHVPSPRQTVRAARRLLKEDGVLIIEVPQQFQNWFDRIARRIGRHVHAKEPSLHHVYFFTPRTLKMTLEKEGFASAIRTYSVDVPYQKRTGFVRSALTAATRVIDALGGGLYIEAYGTKRNVAP